MKYLLLVLFNVFLFSCNNRISIKPSSTEINKIIKVLFERDTFNFKYCVYDKLFINSLSIKNKCYKDTMIPKTLMAIDYNDLLNTISLNSECRQSDSLFIAYQVDSMKTMSIDITIFNKIKTTNNRKDYNCYEFYLPIFSANMKMAYIQYYINSDSCGSMIKKIIFEKKNNNWTVIKKI